MSNIEIAKDKLLLFLDLHKKDVDVSLINDALYFLTQVKHRKRIP